MVYMASSDSPVKHNIGHNSRAFDQQLQNDIETVLSDDHEAVFRYAQWHIGDYITGTMGMGLEHEGAYIRFLMRLYQRGKPLPDNDSFMATCMNISVRVWRRVKDALIAVGKIIARNGCLTNARFEKERAHRAAEMRKKAHAAQIRWEKSKGKKESLDEVSGKFAESLDETSPKLYANSSKKCNEINDGIKNVHMPTNNQQPITNKKEDTAAATECVATREPPPDEIYGLNGATSLIVEKLGKWINPMMPDYRTAKSWLENSVKLYGANIVRDAFAEVEGKSVNGDIVPRPIPLLVKICIAKMERANAPKKQKVYHKPRPWD